MDCWHMLSHDHHQNGDWGNSKENVAEQEFTVTVTIDFQKLVTVRIVASVQKNHMPSKHCRIEAVLGQYWQTLIPILG